MATLKSFIKPLVPTRLWTALRLARLHHSVRSYKRQLVRHRYGPFEFELELVDPLGAGWYNHDWPELPELKFLQERGCLGSGMRVFDLGAHQGLVALMLANYVGIEGSVIAVEASGHNAAAALRNAQLNKAHNCQILHAAIAERSGKLIFNEGLNGNVDDGKGGWGQVEVDAFSIDDLAARHGQPDLLFLDVEGYECRALKGAVKTLASRPGALVEVHVGVGLESFGGSAEEVLSFFPEAHYDLYFNHENGSEFLPLQSSSPLPSSRFFLAALNKRADKTPVKAI